MNWTDEIHILRRIVALLLALADLAERAGSVPRAARCRALGILRQALASASVAGPARGLGAPVAIVGGPLETVGAPGVASDDDPAAAASLAGCLRALALAWAHLLAWMERMAARPARDCPPRPPCALALGSALAAPPLPRLDSS